MLVPETAVFWGAGATASLKIPTTERLGEDVYKLVTNNFNFAQLNDESYSMPIGYSPKNTEHYDFESLKELAQKIPIESECYGNFLRDLYNIIDNSLQNNLGIKTSKNGFLDINKIKKSRNALDYLIYFLIVSALEKIPGNNPYVEFANYFAELMREESIELKKFPHNKREFYLMSSAIISMNFDTFLMYALMNINKNQNKNPSFLGKFNLPVESYIDLSNILPIKGNGSKLYAVNEVVLSEMNGYGVGKKIYRIGKYYFPHGSTVFRECENCGKTVSLLKSEGGLFSYYNPKHDLEQPEAECPFCKTNIYMRNSAMIMQTGYKGKHSIFLEDVQRDVKICLSGAHHIILFGYSLPPDDIVWRTTFLAKTTIGTQYCSVVIGRNEENKEWLSGETLENYIIKIKKERPIEEWVDFGISTIETATTIFGQENVRAYVGGIPNVWLDNGCVSKDKITDLLYPRKIFERGFPQDIAEKRMIFMRDNQ